MKKLLPLLSLLIVFSISCNFIPLATPPSFEYDDGALVLILDSTDDFKMLTIAPADLSIGSYVISGVFGANVDTFGPDTIAPASSYTINGLTLGDWIITVDAYSGAGGTGNLIATDSVTATITEDSVTTVDILVEPLTGAGTSGTLDLLLSWDPDVVANDPQFPSATLGGVDILSAITINAGTDTADLTGTYEAGYYLLLIRLIDFGGTFDKTIPAAVRIINGYTTTGSIDFNSTGGVTINLDSDLKNPFNVVVTADDVDLSTGASETMTATALIDGTTAGDSYSWYLSNGTEVIDGDATLEDIVVDPILLSLPNGSYTLTAIVGSGGALSSNDINFTVGD